MTTEYTPTTDEVRSRFVYWVPNAIHGELAAKEAAFDRWLAAHDRETRTEALVEAAASFEGPDRFYRAVDVRRRIREGATR